MRRGINKYRKHDNGQAFMSYRGRRIYLGPYGSEKSKKVYRQYLARIEAERAGGVALPVVTDETSIVELMMIYKRHLQEYHAPNGEPTREPHNHLNALRHLEELYGLELGSEFGPKMLVQFQKHLIGKDLSRQYINKCVGFVKRFFRWCVREEHLPPSVSHGLDSVDALRKGKTKAREAPKVGPADMAAVSATMPYLSSVVAAMVQVQHLCGLRPGEVCAFQRECIDTSAPIWLYCPSGHKNEWRGQARVVAIPKRAQEILKPFMDRAPEAYLFSPAESYVECKTLPKSKERKTKVYPCELKRRAAAKEARRGKRRGRAPGEKFTRESYRRSIEYAFVRAEKAGVKIPHWHPNQLRHAAGTEIAQVLGQQAAQRWLGHATLRATDIYAEKQVRELIHIAEQLDSLWSERGSQASD